MIRSISLQNVSQRRNLYINFTNKEAADSVVLNIAEGSTGQTKAVFKVFLSYALRSAIEVVSCLFIAKKRLYVNDIAFKELYVEYEILVKMITALRNSF